MKITFTLTILLLVNFHIIAQEVSVTPVNEDFLQYIQNKTNIKLKTSDGNFFGAIPTPYNFHFSKKTSNNLKADITIPSSYDLREIDNGAYLTSVKSQGNTGTCWAFAAYGAVESYLLKQEKGSYNLSEQNLATCHGFDLDPSQGGNATFPTAYFSRHTGPVLEEDDPYSYPDENASCKGNMTPHFYIEQARFLPGSWDDAYNPDVIKQSLMENGGLYINMYYNGGYINRNDYTYYYDGTHGINHAVLLVGWDDNKIVTGGISSPESKGAWILKNSWGTSWGENGYFYISYEDSKALRSVTYFPSAVNYDPDYNIYFYDECGMVRSMGFGNESAFAIIKFIPKTDEIIEKIGTYINSDNTIINIEVYDDFDGVKTTNLLGTKNNITCNYPGFHTIAMDDSIQLKKDDDFYIKINYNTPGYKFPIPYESNLGSYTKGTTIEEMGKCWISPNGQSESWLPLGENSNYPWDLCIKAYTKTGTLNENSLMTTEDTLITIKPEKAFNMNFNSVEDISNWKITDSNNDEKSWITYSYLGLSNSICVGYNPSSENIADDWFYSPGFILSSDEDYQLTFYYKAGDPEKPEMLSVYIVSESYNSDTSYLLADLTNLTNESYALYSSTFSVPDSGTYYIGFYCHSLANMDKLLIDDVTLGKNIGIEEIQRNMTDSVSSDSTNQIICTKGIITAMYEFNSVNTIYIQDAEQKWSGVSVFDLADSVVSELKIGDEITLNGTVTKIRGKTTIKEASAINIVSSDNLINPKLLALSDEEKPYESMLVSFENVYCSQTPGTNGEWKISDGTNEIKIQNLNNEYIPTLKEEYSSVTGILTFENDEYKLLFGSKNESDKIATDLNNEELSPDEINIYPNPTYGTVTIQFNNQTSTSKKLIVNTIAGKELLKTDLNSNPKVVIIDLSNYVNGIYIIKLIQSGQTYTYKVMKK